MTVMTIHELYDASTTSIDSRCFEKHVDATSTLLFNLKSKLIYHIRICISNCLLFIPTHARRHGPVRAPHVTLAPQQTTPVLVWRMATLVVILMDSVDHGASPPIQPSMIIYIHDVISSSLCGSMYIMRCIPIQAIS